MIGEIVKGLGTTLKHLFQPPVTIQYPEVEAAGSLPVQGPARTEAL
jgi:formate hydrogenlyase subunit 6/NADH:ubiquinone oxidoreductase subunit I